MNNLENIKDLESDKKALKNALGILIESYLKEADPYSIGGFHRNLECDDCIVTARIAEKL